MMIIKRIFIAGIILLVAFTELAGQVVLTETEIKQQYPYVPVILNRIDNSSRLDSFFHKLYLAQQKDTGVIRIVHIGDSHIQADLLSGVLRNAFQEQFGNAGRGLVFPYRQAGSNAPSDIISSSPIAWNFYRLARPDKPGPIGISGFGISSSLENAVVNLALKTGETFDQLKLFVNQDVPNALLVNSDLNDEPTVILADSARRQPFYQVNFSVPTSGFSVQPIDNKGIDFYGFSLEKANAKGVIYHTIGVNGAQYQQYTFTSKFWEQLPALNADMLIVSLGTNEAQRPRFVPDVFEDEVKLFLQKVKIYAPQATVLITTTPESYRGRVVNPSVKQINSILTKVANEEKLPLWDLYRATGGAGSAAIWLRRALMNKDRIHFTAAGYRLQGALLWNALLREYQQYEELKQQPNPLSSGK